VLDIESASVRRGCYVDHCQYQRRTEYIWLIALARVAYLWCITFWPPDFRHLPRSLRAVSDHMSTDAMTSIVEWDECPVIFICFIAALETPVVAIISGIMLLNLSEVIRLPLKSRADSRGPSKSGVENQKRCICSKCCLSHPMRPRRPWAWIGTTTCSSPFLVMVISRITSARGMSYLLLLLER
jgi:hypothetical protein